MTAVTVGVRSPTISAAELAGLLHAPVPTPEQAAIIEAPQQPAVIIAGAGSGKTETMAARVLWLVANQLVDPGAVLGLTFTRKAAAELGARVRRRLAQWRRVVEADYGGDRQRQGELAVLLSGEPTVLTYAAFAGRLVAEHAMRVGAEPNPRLLTPATRWQLADQIVRRFRGDLSPDIGALASIPGYVLALADSMADHLVTPDQVERFCAGVLADWEPLPPGKGIRSARPGETADLIGSVEHRHELMALVRDFAAAKRAGVDYADQMTLATRIAELPAVAAIERSRFAAVLLDEYQDTGHAQIEMLTSLFGGAHPVMAVGDPFQSIYGWRGASAGNIGRFAHRFVQSDGAPATVFPLSTSWRNDRQILQVANAVATPLRAEVAGVLGAIELRARPGAGDGQVLITRAETAADEAEWVAANLRQAWGALPTGERTAAVLVRRRSLIPMLAAALTAAGLPVEVVGLGGLLALPEIVDLVATLRVLADHRSSTALTRLLTGARWRIGPSDLAALNRRARSLARLLGPVDGERVALHEEDAVNLIEALDDLGRESDYSAEGFHRLDRLRRELQGLRYRLSVPLPELVAEVERVIGLDVEVASSADRARIGRVHLDRFLDETAQFAADADEASLRAFLLFLEAAELEDNGLDVGEVVVESERVQVLTVHGAKGLEWDIVAVPGLVEGVFPAATVGQDWTRARQLLPAPLRGDCGDLPRFSLAGAADRLEVRDRLRAHHDEVVAAHADEERRLAYVALTRARYRLFCSGYVWSDTVKTPRAPSVFLAELLPYAELGGWADDPEPDTPNPLTIEPRSAQWPVDPLGEQRAPVTAGAELVRAAVSGPLAARSPRGRTVTDLPLPGLLGDAAEASSDWQRSVDLLLAERARLLRGDAIAVELPAHLSVTDLVALQADPDQLARRLRRPLPARPAPLARRGTAFHAWLEQRWSAQTLLDVDELPGAADESADDRHVEALKDAFEKSAWAGRRPVEVEVGFEMTVAGVVVRGRMDAVFADPDAGFTVVDWKTGNRPRGAAAAAAAVQLAAYRLAWARIRGIADEQLATIRAAFHYVRDNETVAPVDLLDVDGLAALIAGDGPGISIGDRAAR